MDSRLIVTCEKKYRDLPAAHRQPKHDGHCRWIHGHNYGFDLTFSAHARDVHTDFVIDFGKLRFVKELLEHQFDHTLIVVESDPELPLFLSLHDKGLADIRIVASSSAEGMAEWVLSAVNGVLREHTQGRVWCSKVVVWEDSKDSATITCAPIP